jgi:hypothetical protein
LKSEAFRAVFPTEKVQLPAGVLPLLTEIATEMRQDLLTLSGEGKLEIVGNLSDLFDPLFDKPAVPVAEAPQGRRQSKKIRSAGT